MSPLRFVGDFPPFLVLLAAILAAVGVVWIYSRESMTVQSPYNYLLPALRATAVLLTIFVLAGPVWHKRTVVGTLGRVVFAVDTSASMAAFDSGEAGSSPNRMNRAIGVLLGSEGQAGWLETLKSTHEVDVIGFSSGEPALLWSSRGEEPIPTTFDLSPEGRRTDLSVGLRATLDSLDPNRIEEPTDGSPLQRSAFVVMSDGRDNAGPSAVDTAKQLNSQSMAVHAIGMGSEGEPPDVGIVDIVRPENVASDGELAGSLILKQFGMGGKPVKVRIESNGKTVWQKTINATGDGLQRVPFQLDVEPIVNAINKDSERGVLRRTIVMDLRAAIEPLKGDTSDDNNARPFRVAANTRDRRVLIMDGSSRWETRYLRNVFERDPAWTVNTVLFGEGTGTPQLVRGDRDGEFPRDRQGMARYDAIILGEIPTEQLKPDDIERIRYFVSHGGGLIVIDGHYGKLRRLIATQLSDLVPIRYDKTPRLLKGKELKPTAIGFEHPVMNLVAETEQLAEFWSQIPAPSIFNHVSPQQDAEVWGNVISSSGVESPWLVTRLYGGGRVYYFSTDQTWRWRYKVADRFHARFWNQLMAAVMQPPYSASDEYVALGTNKIEYTTSESAVIRARLQDTNAKPVGDATVDALLIRDDKIVAMVPLQVDDPVRGTYLGRTPPLEPGAYDVRVRASGFDESALQASTPIWVSDEETAETRRIGLDVNALTQIAKAAGGSYVHESNAGELLKLIEPLSSGTVKEDDISIWQSFYWFWAVIALLAIEWWLRKRAGLV